MEFDDKIREDNGVVICLRDMGNGKSRLFLDDVAADRRVNPISWSYEHFCTFSPEFDNAALEGMTLNADDFARIGVAVVSRLLALSKRAP